MESYALRWDWKDADTKEGEGRRGETERGKKKYTRLPPKAESGESFSVGKQCLPVLVHALSDKDDDDRLFLFRTEGKEFGRLHHKRLGSKCRG